MIGAVGAAWAALDPFTFTAHVLPWLKGAGWASLAGAGWFCRKLLKAHPITPTWEDWACGLYITGLPGSGKTAFAYQVARRFANQGWGFVWLSIKPSLELLEYLPESARDRCRLFAPHSDNPQGMNLLRCYTGTATERELIADQTAELFDRLHSAMSANMRELIRMGTLALLIWAAEEGHEVTLWELYRLFQEENFRGVVLVAAPKPIRDAFDADEARKTTLQAVRIQLRRTVSTENLLVSLSQRDGIDLWDVIEREQWLICDTPERVMGPGVAGLLCQVIASRVQLLSSRRPSGSRPFACFADEFQEYANPSFAKGIATGREFGLCWVLIHQSKSNQGIGAAVSGAVHLTGTRYYFQQAPEDTRAAVETTGGQWDAQVFTHLPKRHYRALRRIHGRPIIEAGVTRDLPPPNQEVAEEIIAHAASGPARAAILADIQRRRVENECGHTG